MIEEDRTSTTQELAAATTSDSMGNGRHSRVTAADGHRAEGIFDVEDLALLVDEDGETDDRVTPSERQGRVRRILLAILWIVPIAAFLFVDVTARAVRYNLASDPGRQVPLPRPYDESPLRIWQAFFDGVYPLGSRTTALVLVTVGVAGFLLGAFVLARLALLPSEEEWSESLSQHPPTPHPRP